MANIQLLQGTEKIKDSYTKINTSLTNLNNDIINIPHGLYRNAIINGNFDVWQRATSVTNPAHNTYPAADRWKVFVDGSGFPANITHSRQVLDSGDIPGSYYFYRISVDGPGTTPDLYRLAQFVEHGTRYLCGSGKKVTLSFWARSSIPNKRIGLYIRQDYGVGGTPSENINGFNWSLTSVWTKYTATFTTNTLAGKTFGISNDDALSVMFVFAWSSTFMSRVGASTPENFVGAGNIDIAQVQLNAGDVALPFQPRHYTEEFALCRRYCQVYGYGVPGVCRETTAVTLFLPGVNMRVAPTATLLKTSTQIYDGTAAYVSSNSTISPGLRDDNGLTVRLDGFSGLTVGRPVVLDDGRVILLDAEL